jgi:hypothetical protein
LHIPPRTRRMKSFRLICSASTGVRAVTVQVASETPSSGAPCTWQLGCSVVTLAGRVGEGGGIAQDLAGAHMRDCARLRARISDAKASDCAACLAVGGAAAREDRLAADEQQHVVRLATLVDDLCVPAASDCVSKRAREDATCTHRFPVRTNAARSAEQSSSAWRPTRPTNPQSPPRHSPAWRAVNSRRRAPRAP